MYKKLLLTLALAPLSLRGSLDEVKENLGKQATILAADKDRALALVGQLQEDLAAHSGLKEDIIEGRKVIAQVEAEDAAYDPVTRLLIAKLMSVAKSAGDRAIDNQKVLLKHLDKLLSKDTLGKLTKEAPQLAETLGKLSSATSALSGQ